MALTTVLVVVQGVQLVMTFQEYATHVKLAGQWIPKTIKSAKIVVSIQLDQLVMQRTNVCRKLTQIHD